MTIIIKSSQAGPFRTLTGNRTGIKRTYRRYQHAEMIPGQKFGKLLVKLKSISSKKVLGGIENIEKCGTLSGSGDVLRVRALRTF
jgi:hypothetical protein